MLAANALTTLERAKSFLGIAPEDTSSDEALYFSINTVSALIEKYCNRVFKRSLFNESIQGRGGMKLILRNYPIESVSFVTINDEEIDLQSIRVMSDEGMLYRPSGGFSARVRGGTFMHPGPDELYHNIYVEYTAGYVLPKDATDDNPRTLPFDIELACLRMMAVAKRDREVNEGVDLVLKRETIGDWTGEYEKANKGTDAKLNYMDADIMNILSLHRRTEWLV